METTFDTAIYVLIGVLAVFYVPAGIALALAYRRNARDWAPFLTKGD